jgi:hypothetical protein
MLALETGPYQNLLNPDYTLSSEQVCFSLAINSVKRTGKLEFLGHLSEYQNPTFPSFIPNWTGEYAWNGDRQNKLEMLPFYNACFDLPANMKVISWKMISLGGVVFDMIGTTASNICDSYGSTESMRGLKRMAPTEHLGEERYCHTSDTQQEVFLQTICGGMEMFDDGLSWNFRRMKEPLAATKIQFLHQILGISSLQPSGVNDSESEIQRLAQDLLIFQIATHERQFFRSRKGYIGFGPAKCQEGDLVVVLAGGTVPYIIRPVSPSRQKSMVIQGRGENLNEEELLSNRWYTILGTAYVHGIMDGEAFEVLDENERQLKDIILV